MIPESSGWVIGIGDADPADVERLGGKGASLATLKSLGVSVPPAFVISTELCRHYAADRSIPEGVWDEVSRGIALLEDSVGRHFGEPEAPLLVSVRSGAPVSMPGMMDTILNVGLTAETVPGLAAMTGDDAFGWDSYTRLLKMFGSSVRDLSPAKLAAARLAGEDRGGTRVERLQATAEAYLELMEREGEPFPEDPEPQLRESVEAVLRSWQSSRARRYRRHKGISEDLGTAVVIQAMVFGNLDEESGSGVAFTRDPATGEAGLYGDYLARAQGEDVVSGESPVDPISAFVQRLPEAEAELRRVAAILESHYLDMCDIEFTVESGKLWILQVRVGQRTGVAQLRIALDLLVEGLISIDVVLDRVTPATLAHPPTSSLAEGPENTCLGRGVAASPGAAIGAMATTSQEAEQLAARGANVILVTEDTSPKDIGGFIAAKGIVTARGGRASHAAVVARGMDRPAVCNVAGLKVGRDSASFDTVTVTVGETLSIDGGSGEVYAGAVSLVTPPRHSDFERFLTACDTRRRLPILSTQAEEWSDGIFDPSTAIECSSVERLENAVLEAAEQIVILPGAAEDPAALLAAACTLEQGAIVRVGPDWPANVRHLPRGSWRSIVADSGGGPPARLLAATVDQ
jgi:pyruvate,orthophosphate dikinase